MEKEKKEKKGALMARVKKMEGGDTIRLDIIKRNMCKGTVYPWAVENQKKFSIRTAKNKRSFTLTRTM